MADTSTVDSRPKAALRHEEFCLPRPEATELRVESYLHYEDDPRSGRSRPTHKVTRCVECGAANYDRTEK